MLTRSISEDRKRFPLTGAAEQAAGTDRPGIVGVDVISRFRFKKLEEHRFP